MDLITILQKNVSIGLKNKRRNLAQLMFHLTKIRNVRLGNALDVDLKITWSQNVPSHQNIIRIGEIKYVLNKEVILHATMTKIAMTIKYTHLWHKCIVMTNAKVESTVIVRNWPIGFGIWDQCATWHEKFRNSFQEH